MMSGLLCIWHMYSFNLQLDQWKICIKETTEAINLGGLESHKLPAHLFFCERPAFRFPLNWCCWACWAHNSASIDCPEPWHWTEEKTELFKRIKKQCRWNYKISVHLPPNNWWAQHPMLQQLTTKHPRLSTTRIKPVYPAHCSNSCV